MDLTGIGSIADLVKGVVDRVWPADASAESRLNAELEIQRMMASREEQVVAAQREIIVSEMNQGDNYTKRARPTIVYAGLGFIFLVHVIAPLVAFATGRALPNLSLPEEFWWAWSSVVGIWAIGRSAEKTGKTGKVTGLITGNK